MKKSFNKFTLLITLLICMLPFLNVAATDNNQLLPFANSVEVDGLTIMVDDPNGIIPNGAYLDVKKVKQKKIS